MQDIRLEIEAEPSTIEGSTLRTRVSFTGYPAGATADGSGRLEADDIVLPAEKAMAALFPNTKVLLEVDLLNEGSVSGNLRLKQGDECDFVMQQVLATADGWSRPFFYPWIGVDEDGSVHVDGEDPNLEFPFDLMSHGVRVSDYRNDMAEGES